MSRWQIIAFAWAAACVPSVDTPAERQRAIDHEDAARVTAQLTALPGVAAAEVMILRSTADPFVRGGSASAPAASAVVIIDDGADRFAIAGTAAKLLASAVPQVEPTIIIEQGAVRPSLARVGPFTVEARSHKALRAALTIALVLILVLAAWIAYRERTLRRDRTTPLPPRQ